MCQVHYAKWRNRIGLPPVLIVPADGENEFGERFCASCDLWLDPWDFDKGKTCRLCSLERNAAARKNSTRGKFRNELLLAQDGLCEICSTDIAGVMSDGRALAHLDHDHACCPGPLQSSCGDCIRGALCRGCNNGLGNFRDSVDNLLAAVTYLNDWKVHKQEVGRAA